MRREEPHRCIGQMRPANKIIVHVVIAIQFDGRNLGRKDSMMRNPWTAMTWAARVRKAN